MHPLLFVHLIAVGLWAGCIATEVVLELTEGQRPPLDSRLAPLHAWVDRAVELPAIAMAALTGGALLHHSPIATDPLLQAKVGLGASAVPLNLAAAFTVQRRYQAWLRQDLAAYAHAHLWHERIGVGCVLTLVSALLLGGWRLTGALAAG